MKPEWRTYAKPNEIVEYDGLIAADRANAAKRKLIRNRCRMRRTKTQPENPLENPLENPA